MSGSAGHKSSWVKSSAAKELAERQACGGYSLEELDEVANDVTKWAIAHGKVLDLVSREPVPFRPRRLQRRLFDYYYFCQEGNIPCRMVCCKVRRGGGSTASEAILYVHGHNFNARLGAIGTDHDVSMNMYKFILTFDKEDDFPGWAKASKKLETGRMEWANGSSWEKYTAENPEAARSAGLQGYHATEVARWMQGGAQDAGETLKSMLGAVPKRGFTVVIEESTANGAAGALYSRWQKARWPTAAELGAPEGAEYWRKWEAETPQNLVEVGGELQFVRVFAAWFEDDENAVSVSESQVQYLTQTLDEKERKLIERYQGEGEQGPRLGDVVGKATVWEQLAWRRSVIESEFEGDVEGFEQEYPSSPAEAFASSGRHSFNVKGVAEMVTLSKSSHPEYGVLSEQWDGNVVFTRTETSSAWLQVWEVPRAGMRYVIGLDTMSGAEQVAGSRNHDYHASGVLRAAYTDDDGVKRRHRTAASIMPKSVAEPDVLAKQVDLLHRFYGRCLVVPEINNTGYAFLLEAKRLGMNIFRREHIDKFTSEPMDKAGWETNEKTRPQLVNAMQAAIRNNAQEATRCDGLECNSYALASQCATMVKNTKGKDVAAPGANDDEVLAWAMALANVSGATYYAGKVRKRRGPADRKNWRRYGQR